ncbi:MAG: hypothetical protein KA802_11750 [Saprospiraceae bacterium]|nr:hypothetical protein [Saprospiraceae bacterium]MBP8892707.1 hypothetical protein [Saprospiraceae bacterium]
MSQLILIQEKKCLINSIYFLFILFFLVFNSSCDLEADEKNDLSEIKECDFLFQSIFNLDNQDSLVKTYLRNLVLDSNLFRSYVIHPSIEIDRTDGFICEEYIFNNTDFMLPELYKEGLEFCIDSNNSIKLLGNIIDPKDIKYSVAFFLGAIYSESKLKAANYIYNDSIDICIDVVCNKLNMTQNSFDWNQYFLLLSEIYNAINDFRDDILNDAFNVNISNASEAQLTLLRNYYNTIIYVEHRNVCCRLFEPPKVIEKK